MFAWIFLTGRKPHFHSANRLFNEIHETNLTATVSPATFSNMFYILRLRYGMLRIVPKLKAFRSFIYVAPLTGEHIDLALDSGWDDIEDAMQYFCALKANSDAIITRNVKDFSKSAFLCLRLSIFWSGRDGLLLLDNTNKWLGGCCRINCDNAAARVP